MRVNIESMLFWYFLLCTTAFTASDDSNAAPNLTPNLTSNLTPNITPNLTPYPAPDPTPNTNADPDRPSNDTTDTKGLFLRVYASVFSLKDGSQLDDTDTRAVDTLRASVQRLLGVGTGADTLSAARRSSDEELLRILFLAVAGEFTVSQSPSALPQRCALVVDASSGELVLRDSTVTQSVILEVLLIVSIVCLMRAWGDQRR